MDAALRELFDISRFYGSDPDYVLAGGGNTSLKAGGLLHIKASGTSLAEASAATFVAMDRARLALMWKRRYPEAQQEREAAVLADLTAAIAPGSKLRPSVETLLHDVFPQSLVVHTHPALVNGLTCGRDGERLTAEILGSDALWVEAIEPGYVLATRMRELMEAWRARHGRDAEVVLIQNHGLFVAAKDTAGIRRLTEQVMSAVSGHAGRLPDERVPRFDRERAARLAPALRMMLKGEEEGSILAFRSSGEIERRVADDRAFRVFDEPFTPDHMVYCGRKPLWIPAETDLEVQYQMCARLVAAYKGLWGASPRVIAVQGLGLFFWGPTKKEAETSAALFRDALRVACYAESFGGSQPMPPSLVSFIEGWEVERFRKKVAAGARGPGPRLAGRIALVTGGGQGIGAGLAASLAAEGAHVVVADVNAAQAGERAAEIVAARGAGAAVAARADVGDAESVWALMVETALEYGGLDLLVSNAGILRAGDLEATDAATFDLVTRVNYSGYYHCTRAAARLMRIQHRYAPEWWMDIVQINSKSGLVGSKKNFAYAGGKFGGIGLTQSFALELVEHGVKVNSICPGNFFDGPLWSDPTNGLFVQYLAAGKVAGARTVEDVKRYYESLVPMGRGCAVDDVFRALLYAVEQRYETGQAIPVTGGQVMLS